MSLFEWFFESYNPGPTGRIRTAFDKRRGKPLKRIWVILIILGGQALFWGAIYAYLQQNGWNNFLYFLIGVFIYLILAFWLEPEPDNRNVGWLGGLMDNPFRISDDFNRFLYFLIVLLLPGKLVSHSFLYLYQIVRYEWLGSA